MINRRRLLQLSVILLLTVAGLLVAYNSSSDQISRALIITEPNCQLPCWHGLTPGVTTETEFLSVVANSTGASFNDLERFVSDQRSFFYRWHDSSFGLTVQAVFEDGTLSWIRIFVEPHELKEIVDVLGPPDSYQALIEGGEQDMLVFYTFYQGHGVFVDLFTVPYQVPVSASSPICSINVNERMEANAIYIVPRSTEEMMLEHVWAVERSPIHPWNGFGNIALSECY